MDNNDMKLSGLNDDDVMKLMGMGDDFLNNLPEIKKPVGFQSAALDPLPSPESILTEPYDPVTENSEQGGEYPYDEAQAEEAAPYDVNAYSTEELTYDEAAYRQPAVEEPAYDTSAYQVEDIGTNYDPAAYRQPAAEEPAYDPAAYQVEELGYDPAAYQQPAAEAEELEYDASAYQVEELGEASEAAYEQPSEEQAYDTSAYQVEELGNAGEAFDSAAPAQVPAYATENTYDTSAYQTEQTSEGDFSENGYASEDTEEAYDYTYQPEAAGDAVSEPEELTADDTVAVPDLTDEAAEIEPELASEPASELAPEPAAVDMRYEAPALEEEDDLLPPITRPKPEAAPKSKPSSLDFDFELPELPSFSRKEESKPKPKPEPRDTIKSDILPDLAEEDKISGEEALEKQTEKYDTSADLENLESPQLSEMDGAVFNVKKSREKSSVKQLTPQDIAQQEFDMIADGKDKDERDYEVPDDARKPPVGAIIGAVAALAAVGAAVMFLIQ